MSAKPKPGVYRGKVLTVQKNRSGGTYVTGRCEGIQDLVEVDFPAEHLPLGAREGAEITVHVDKGGVVLVKFGPLLS